MKNQTHSFQPLLSPAPFWRLKESVSMDAACSVPACHHAWERASANTASVLLLQPLVAWLWHLTFWICWKNCPRTHSEAKGSHIGRTSQKGFWIQWLTGTWGVIITWMDSELLAWRKALAHGARFQRSSQSRLTQPPAFLARCTLPGEAGVDKTTTKLLSFRWWWLRLCSAARGCWQAGWALLMAPCFCTGWSCPSPAAPSGSPSRATVPQESWPVGEVVRRSAGLGLGLSTDKPPPCGGRRCNIPSPFVRSWGGEIVMELGKKQVGYHPTAHSLCSWVV